MPTRSNEKNRIRVQIAKDNNLLQHMKENIHKLPPLRDIAEKLQQVEKVVETTTIDKKILKNN